MLEECGGAFMCRIKSKVRFGQSYAPQVVRPLETNKRKKQDNLSYCFAVILPNKDEADRYCAGLESDQGPINKVSDQAHVSYHVREKYVLLHMNMCVFFSWLNHEDVMQDHIKDVIRELEYLAG